MNGIVGAAKEGDSLFGAFGATRANSLTHFRLDKLRGKQSPFPADSALLRNKELGEGSMGFMLPTDSSGIDLCDSGDNEDGEGGGNQLTDDV